MIRLQWLLDVRLLCQDRGCNFSSQGMTQFPIPFARDDATTFQLANQHRHAI